MVNLGKYTSPMDPMGNYTTGKYNPQSYQGHPITAQMSVDNPLTKAIACFYTYKLAGMNDVGRLQCIFLV